jgi:hypothetical protein
LDCVTGGIANVDIELSGTGAVQVDILDPGGSEYAGAVTLEIQQGAGVLYTSRFVTIDHGPYFLEGLYPGRYRLRIEKLAGVNASEQLTLHTDVQMHRVTNEVMQLVD